jgi:flagellar motor switch protein FliG
VSRVALGETARAFRQKLSQLVQLDEKGTGRLLAETILQRASADERGRILAGLRDEPETLRAALGSFVGKETLAALDLDVIASVVAQLDLRVTALFLSTLDEELRERVLAALPRVTATALGEELDSAASPLEREGATRVVLAAIRRLVDERGIDLAAANWKIFLGGKAQAAS